jgi:acyl-CoA thioester hydrolase
MARIRIELPAEFTFHADIPIRISDLNYGGHVGNDSILSIIHEARVQFLNHHGLREFYSQSAGLIMSDAAIEFKNELFYGDKLKAFVTARDFTRVGFDLYYRLEKEKGDDRLLVAVAKTGMICFDYQKKKMLSIPDELKLKLQAG